MPRSQKEQKPHTPQPAIWPELLIRFHMTLLLMPVVSAVYMMSETRNPAYIDLLFAGSAILLLPAFVSRSAEKHFQRFSVNFLLDALTVLAACAFAWLYAAIFFDSHSLQVGFTIGILVLSTIIAQGCFQKRYAEAALRKAKLTNDQAFRKKRYFLDEPERFYLVWFVLLYLLGISFNCPEMCNIAIGSDTVYLIIELFYERLTGTDRYLDEMHYVTHIPRMRLKKAGNMAAGVFIVLCLAALIPTFLTASHRKYMDLRNLNTEWSGEMLDFAQLPEDTMLFPEMPPEYSELTPAQGDPLPWLEPLIMLIAWAMFAGILILLLKNLRVSAFEFREGFGENGDVIRALEKDETVKIIRPRREREPKSERERIRREYRKRVRKNLPGGPMDWETPEEIEAHANIDDPDLHERYEKARYT